MIQPIHMGLQPMQNAKDRVQGSMVFEKNERYYKISNYDRMPAFFMSLVSDSDCWLFISSNGALTAGRGNPDQALFPYYTDDRIHDLQDISGSKTLLLITRQETTSLWEPFSFRYEGVYAIQRNLYKNSTGNKVIFEEINHDLGVMFRILWTTCDRFGFIKKSWIVNPGDTPVQVHFLDGIQNILPYGTDQKFQLEYSTLLDGYKRNGRDEDSVLAVYALSSIPTDKAEPSEALKATTVWSAGLKKPVILLSSRQIDRFRKGHSVQPEQDVKAARGAYFVQAEINLGIRDSLEWVIAADLHQDAGDVAKLRQLLKTGNNLTEQINDAVDEDTDGLVRKVTQADGIQVTGDALNTSRHFSNTLFNIMRGGVFNGYTVLREDFRRHMVNGNRQAAARHESWISRLPGQLPFSELIAGVRACDDPVFEKLTYEYLPLTFSRRHGDPSRPWNRFSIELKDDKGNRLLNYQGNWRDIFQNWEALSLSFPDYLENMIAKFVNATTADGYNPYRITREGFDWEVLDPSDTWSYIGYWGDHQIVYLMKLLEWSSAFHPGKLETFLSRKIFAYADVPYRIRAYQALLANPRETIDFDFDAQKYIQDRVRTTGSDGKLLQDSAGRILLVNFSEKLLVPLLAKLSNFIPEAGIWMNTQRPEWNDANNALVGPGCSMVTLYYMRRFTAFCEKLFLNSALETVELSGEVMGLLSGIENGLKIYGQAMSHSISDLIRKQILDSLGEAGSQYRMQLYSTGLGENSVHIPVMRLVSFLQLTLRCIDHSIRANQRNDRLFHAYNLAGFQKNEVSIRTLYEMLEGQVAVLSSGLISAREAVALLKSLRKSALYREDQFSYMLYPERQLPAFMEKNVIPGECVKKSRLLLRLIEKENRDIIYRDIEGRYHFNGKFRNAGLLKQSLDALPRSEFGEVADESADILALYESVFDHQSFTGRSGTFYKYEGLGSIYWHMVSKLLLAVQEIFYRAVDSGEDQHMIEELRKSYYEIRAGIGSHKPPELYGAVPTDPYSHTPAFSGVQQPGMTGQVKEDIISRYGELGLRIDNGCLRFEPRLLDKNELSTEPQAVHFHDVSGAARTLQIDAGTLFFTFCQVPVIMQKEKTDRMIIYLSDQMIESTELCIGQDLSSSIFGRKNIIRQITLGIRI